MNWTVCVIDGNDDQETIQSKINGLLEIKR